MPRHAYRHLQTRVTVEVAVSGPERIDHPHRHYRPVRPQLVTIEYVEGEPQRVLITGTQYRQSGELGRAQGTVKLWESEIADMPEWLAEIVLECSPPQHSVVL